MTTQLTRKQVGGSTKGRGKTCRKHRQGCGRACKQLRHHRQRRSKPVEDEQLEFSAFFKVRRLVIFLRVKTGFGCLEKTSTQPPECVNNTPTISARTELHNTITFHHANTHGSRAAKPRIAHLCVLKQLSSTCHVSFLAAPDTDQKHKFSHTYITYLSEGLTFTNKPTDPRPIYTLRCSTAE